MNDETKTFGECAEDIYKMIRKSLFIPRKCWIDLIKRKRFTCKKCRKKFDVCDYDHIETNSVTCPSCNNTNYDTIEDSMKQGDPND